MPESRTQEAIELMEGFARRTGLTSGHAQQRYLWTDAFAVCNFLGLARASGEARYAELAYRLVDRVHHTLGRHRADDQRTGWISGLGEEEGEEHPTWGGLRIGKALPERGLDQPFNERLKWDRDGQYFHYLTQWMHALDQLTRATGQARFNRWARELAATAHRAFTYVPATGGQRRMYWKMSIDLSRPLVHSMGQHDPLDGYISYMQLRSTAARFPELDPGPDLQEETCQMEAMIEGGDWATDDPLGLGVLLIDAFRVEQLMREGGLADGHLLEILLTAALAGLNYYVDAGELQLPVENRLAFRELGLAIGLHAVRRMQPTVEDDQPLPSVPSGVQPRLESLMKYVLLSDAIEAFWCDPEHQLTRTWTGHRDINEVMLATSLAPDGFLVLPPVPDVHDFSCALIRPW